MIAALIAGVVAGCGGGGGGSSEPVAGSSAAATDGGLRESVAAPSAAAVPVQLTPTSIVIKDAAVLATTDANTSAGMTLTSFMAHPVKSLRTMIEASIPSAYAFDGGGKQATRKMVGQVLSTLGTTFEITKVKLGPDGRAILDMDGKPTLTTETTRCAVPADSDVLIKSAIELLPDVFLVEMSYPNVMNANCSIGSYVTKNFIVGADDKLYSLEDTVKYVRDVVAASDLAYNTSGEALLVGQDNAIWKVSLGTNHKVVLTKLPIAHNPSYTSGRFNGSIVYDGANVIAQVLKTGPTLEGIALSKLDSTNLTQVLVTGFTTSYTGMFLDQDGDFILNVAPSGLYKINKASGAQESKWQLGQFPFYGARGRYGNIVMDDRCHLFDLNAKTTQSIYTGVLRTLNYMNTSDYSDGGNTSKSYMKGNYAYCVTGDKTLFVRLDMRDLSIRKFDLTGRNLQLVRFTLDRDVATLHAIENVTNNHFYKLDFNTETETDLGVMNSSDGKVTQLLSLGR